MQLRSEIQLTSMLKAMQDVVLPAIDPANRLAVEQSQLIMGMLNLMATQLPLQHRFDRDELQRLVATYTRLEQASEAAPALRQPAEPLAALRRAAEQMLPQCSVDPAELHQAVRTLREALGSFVAEVGVLADDSALPLIKDAILDLSREQLLRERALMAPQGWEADPAAVPSIHSLLTPAAQAPTSPIAK
jgi:hypothetical protein